MCPSAASFVKEIKGYIGFSLFILQIRLYRVTEKFISFDRMTISQRLFFQIVCIKLLYITKAGLLSKIAGTILQ